jgi:hypothetical protein
MIKKLITSELKIANALLAEKGSKILPHNTNSIFQKFTLLDNNVLG